MYKSIAAKLSPPRARALAKISIRLAAMALTSEAPAALQRTVMGLSFPGPVGLAAGFDKHGELYPAIPALGFGFAEIGSVIPKPEMKRSHGIDSVTAILSRYPRPHPIPLGISISMNKTTTPGKMTDDYLACMKKVWPYADYIAINLGVRAGPDLHLPERRATLRSVLAAAKGQQRRLLAETGKRRPVVIKIDQTRGDTDALLDCVQEFRFDGVILSGDGHQGEGRTMLTNLEQVVHAIDGRMPVISVGGIRSPRDAADRLAAGAALVQIYSGLVASGPLLPRRINAYLSNSAAGS